MTTKLRLDVVTSCTIASHLIPRRFHCHVLTPSKFAIFPRSCFRHRLLPSPHGSCYPPPLKGSVLQNPSRHDILTSSVPFRVDFVQDLRLKEPKGCKPASKVPCSLSSLVLWPQPSTHSRLYTSSQAVNDHVGSVKEFVTLTLPQAPALFANLASEFANHDAMESIPTHFAITTADTTMGDTEATRATFNSVIPAGART